MLYEAGIEIAVVSILISNQDWLYLLDFTLISSADINKCYGYIMLQNLFSGLFDTSLITVITVSEFLLCIGVSILIGIFIAFIYWLQNRGTRGGVSKSFLSTLCMLPAVVCIVIMMVNGNIGAGVAVAGAFNLVRFRSAPGTAREIGTLFVAMGAGLIAGMGYLAYAVLFTIIIGALMLVLRFAGARDCERELIIMIPEDLNYSRIFDDLFIKYTSSHRLTSVKTSNMGSLFKLRYSIAMKNQDDEKAFIDELRCRNGNLEISICDKEENPNEL